MANSFYQKICSLLNEIMSINCKLIRIVICGILRYLNYGIATNHIRTQNTMKIHFVVVRLECAFSTSQTLTLDAIIFCITIVCNIYTYTYNKSFMELLSRFPKLIM